MDRCFCPLVFDVFNRHKLATDRDGGGSNSRRLSAAQVNSFCGQKKCGNILELITAGRRHQASSADNLMIDGDAALSASIHQLARGIYLISVLENGWLGRIKRKIVSEFIYFFWMYKGKRFSSRLKPDRFTRKNLVRCFLLVTNHLIIIICRLQEEGCKMKFRLEAPRNGNFFFTEK